MEQEEFILKRKAPAHVSIRRRSVLGEIDFRYVCTLELRIRIRDDR